MPITGQESTLEAQLIAAIQAGIAESCGTLPLTPNCINGLAKGIANAIIPFLTANLQVNAGQTVVTVGGPTTQTGATTTPGTVS